MAAARTTLHAGYAALALRLQEASGDLSNSDITARLADEIQDQHRGTGKWGYFICYFGDAESGDVIYSCDGDVRSAPYEISGGGGKAAKCTIDMLGSKNVVPRTIYEEEAEDPDYYSAMQEAAVKDEVYTALPLYERFIAKDERDQASSGSFAGKGKSYPILKPEDVKAAAHAIGRAGPGNYSANTLKKNIISIAKRKGWTKYLPKAWQGDEGGGNGKSKGKESAISQSDGQLKLVESAAFPADITIREALSPGRKIKLIAPGKGSTAYYTAEALKKAAETKIFRAGTPMRIDHPTAAEEEARPEGSVKDWGAVLGSDAVYMESYVAAGKDLGPGLYSDIKPFSDHAQTIEEKSPYAGVSICANGRALMEAGRPVLREGVPVLEEFISAEGVDMVTRAGAGGLFLQESAHPAGNHSTQEAGMAEGMTAEQAAAALKSTEAANSIGVQISEAVAKATAPLLERTRRQDAEAEANRLLESVSWPRTAKQYVIREAMKGTLPATAAGDLDVAKFREGLVAIAKEFGRVLGEAAGSGAVFGMGSSASFSEAGKPMMDDEEDDDEDEGEEEDAPPKKKIKKKAKESARHARHSDRDPVRIFESLGLPADAAKFAAVGRNGGLR